MVGRNLKERGVAKEKRRMKMSKLTLSIVAIVGMLMLGSAAFGSVSLNPLLTNISLEDATGGIPDNWLKTGEADYHVNPGDAPYGDDYVSVANQNYYQQIFTFVLDETYTLSGKYKSRGTGNAGLRIAFQASKNNNDAWTEILWTFPGASEWTDFTISADGFTQGTGGLEFPNQAAMEDHFVQIRGSIQSDNTEDYVYVDLFVPEPATLAFLGLGTLGTMLLRKKRR